MTDHTDFKIPRGVAMMLKNIIGIDPDEIMRQFHAALLAFKQDRKSVV